MVKFFRHQNKLVCPLVLSLLVKSALAGKIINNDSDNFLQADDNIIIDIVGTAEIFDTRALELDSVSKQKTDNNGEACSSCQSC